MENKLPKGWEIKKLVDHIPIIKTGVEKFDEEKSYYSTGSIADDKMTPEGRFTFRNRPARANRLVLEKDVVQARMRETQKAVLVDKNLEGSLLSTGFLQFRPEDNNYNSKLFYYYLRSDRFLKQRDEYATGSTQVALTDEGAENIDLVVPPQEQQNRIADKLDALLAKVKDAQSRLDKILLILKRFRQSVLAAACSGRLTADWRKQKKIYLEQWTIAILGKVADSRLGKMLDKAKNVGKLMRYLRNINVRWFTFNLTDLAFIRATSEDKKEFAIRDGDLLICEGGEPGRCAVWDSGNTDLIFQKAIHRVRLDNTVSAYWLALNIKNDANSNRLEEYFTGSTIKHLTGKALERYEFSLPSIDEQHEIVRRVKELFALADKIETRYIKAQGYIDKLEQSILAKAFRGELVK